MASTQYAIIDTATGEVILTGRATPEALPAIQSGIPGTQSLIEIAEGALRPVPNQSKWDDATKTFVDHSFVTLPLNTGSKLNQLRQRCQQVIVGGFTSSALGAVHTYPSGQIDQLNMLQGGDLMCADSSGDWALRTHNSTQTAQVCADFITMRDNARATLATKISSVIAATTQAEIDAITWE